MNIEKIKLQQPDHQIYLTDSFEKLTKFKTLTSKTAERFKEGKNHQEILFDGETYIGLALIQSISNDDLEKCRIFGSELFNYTKERKEIKLKIDCDNSDLEYAYLEGLLLSSNENNLLKKEKQSAPKLSIDSNLEARKWEKLKITTKWVNEAKKLVNLPQNHLHVQEILNYAEQKHKGQPVTIDVKLQEDLKEEAFGGILAVNRGSKKGAALLELSHYPTDSKKNPIILVGKGVVYDTGGLSLKPTENSMDIMKCDMAGAAAAITAFFALVELGIGKPIKCIVPLTDNWIGPKSIAPGDVITMYDKTTVEVMNTDAEGRLILADALSYSKKFAPEMVIDLATLTGAAVRAIGTKAIAIMGNNPELTKKAIDSGYKTHERCVEFPLWEDFKKELDSDIADIKNLGSSNAGMITAGKFLEHFVDYQWMHMDIAGPAYLGAPDGYRPKNGTGAGVRLLIDLLL